jgi:hypothetical protein
VIAWLLSLATLTAYTEIVDVPIHGRPVVKLSELPVGFVDSKVSCNRDIVGLG